MLPLNLKKNVEDLSYWQVRFSNALLVIKHEEDTDNTRLKTLHLLERVNFLSIFHGAKLIVVKNSPFSCACHFFSVDLQETDGRSLQYMIKSALTEEFAH